MANSAHRNISQMISAEFQELSQPLWNLILEFYLQEFVREDTVRYMTNPGDMKLFTSCLANAKISGIISRHS